MEQEETVVKLMERRELAGASYPLDYTLRILRALPGNIR
jgi:hypothetical protein